jgi:hypothetical protein
LRTLSAAGRPALLEVPVDTLIFLSIFASLLTMWAGKRSLALVLFSVCLLATLLLFGSHVTDPLRLNF